MDVTEAELWSRWTARRDREARDALVVMHAAWSRLVARDVYLRVRWRGADWSDFVQNATVGLIEATDRFDPLRGIEFRTFARHRVRGAVFNGLRHLGDGGTARSMAFDRRMSLDDGADRADPLEHFVALTVGLGIGHLLDAASAPEPDGHPAGPYAEVERAQSREAVQAALGRLPERERLILTLHYFQHVAFIDIADMLGLSKGRISQLHKQAVVRLREHLSRHRDDWMC